MASFILFVLNIYIKQQAYKICQMKVHTISFNLKYVPPSLLNICVQDEQNKSDNSSQKLASIASTAALCTQN